MPKNTTTNDFGDTILLRVTVTLLLTSDTTLLDRDLVIVVKLVELSRLQESGGILLADAVLGRSSRLRQIENREGWGNFMPSIVPLLLFWGTCVFRFISRPTRSLAVRSDSIITCPEK